MEIKQGGQKYYSVLIQIRYFRKSKSKAYGLVCGLALAGALAFSAGNVSADEVTATDGSNALAVVTDHTQDNTQTTHTAQVSNDMQPVSSEANKTYTDNEHTSSAVQNIDQDKHLSGVVHEVESDDAFTIDHAIKVTDKQQDGLTIRTITWDGNGPYHLEKAVNQIKDDQFPIWNKEAISEEATKRQISVIVSGGFWQLENADNTWSQKEINAGKTGILYSDGNGHVAATTLNNTSINQVFELQGENGWNTGAFGAFVIDGKLEPSFGKDSRWQGDPNEKNGRTLFIEYKDGKQEIVIINGHTSQKTGYSHTDIVDYVQQIGLDKIKLAFLLDGGGSTRGYTKADDGKQSIVGSFVDNRRVATYLYLTKESPKEETLNETNKDKVSKNESQSITYRQWKNAVDNDIETIPGTVYKNTNTDEVVESSQNIPYNTRYVSDETVEAGVRKIITQGENGTKNIITTYKRHNGVHTGKYTTSEAISKQPVDKVVSVGTKAVVSSTIIPIVEKVRENAKVPRGQRTILQEGKEGNVTTTTSYKLLPDGNLSSSITEAREEMEPHIIEVGTGENVVLPIVTNYVGDDSLAKGAIQVIQSGEAHVEDVTGRVLTEGAPRIIHIGTRPQVSETDGLRMTTTYSVNPATGELSETSTAIPLVAPSQDELPDGYVVVDNPTEQKNQIDRDGLSNVLDKSSSSSNATENQNKLSVDMTKKAISSPSSQRIKEVGVLPHTGEKATSAIATAGAVILTTALGMLGFAKRKENNF
ncbi:G5 domain-containing protein [Streptococcus vestibularis]|uniref:G5 domain-containing protein n=1 Tax=Streptococcus vestibularis TaxID=1343 RepID=UPI002284D1FF|nr:G5 domain-containing protein [Streptococcus vestibularis]MCY7043763.1 G5 domain-containing protein [Streptococcus vestibularis]